MLDALCQKNGSLNLVFYLKEKKKTFSFCFLLDSTDTKLEPPIIKYIQSIHPYVGLKDAKLSKQSYRPWDRGDNVRE